MISARTPYWNRRLREERRIEGLAPTLTNQRGLKGAKLGPANSGRKLNAAERQAIENQMRRDGKL
jgi:hypothetical protein